MFNGSVIVQDHFYFQFVDRFEACFSRSREEKNRINNQNVNKV